MVIHLDGAWHTGNAYDQDQPGWVIETDGATYKTPVCHLAILVRKYCGGQFTGIAHFVEKFYEREKFVRSEM